MQLNIETIERLLRRKHFGQALAALFEFLSKNPSDRTANLYVLLAKAQAVGAERYEQEIDGLRGLSLLDDHEKELVRRIFLFGYHAAETAGDQEKMWSYQRLLRKLILGQPLNQPIPITPNLALSSTPDMPIELVVSAPDEVLEPIEATAPVIPFRAKKPLTNNLRRPMALALGVVALLIVPLAYFGSRKTPIAVRHVAVTHLKLPQAATASDDVALLPDAQGTKPEDGAPLLTPDQHQVARQLANLRRAYGRWMVNNTTLTGSVLLNLTVDSAGKVVHVEEVRSRLSDHGFIDVVVAEARQWKFSATSGEPTEITIPLLFVPKEPGTRAATPSAPVSERKLAIPLRPHAAEPSEVAKSVSQSDSFRSNLARAERAEITSQPSVRLDLADQQATGYKTLRAVRLVEKPSFASTIVQVVDRGSSVIILGKIGDWLHVKVHSSAVVGYVRREYVDAAEAAR
jgi:hypothetical protein